MSSWFESPNVLFLMSDQHAARVMGCAGHSVQTPHLDRLAARAARFDNAFCQAPVCVAARGSLITGLYPEAHGANLLGDALSDRLRTVAHHFAEQGYQTAAIGRMHFVDESRRHGFEYRINEADYRASLSDEERARIAAASQPGGSVEGIPSDLPQHLWQDSYMADQTIRFLQERRDRDRPFLLWSSYLLPHTPLNPMRQYFERYDPASLTLPERRDDALEDGFEGHLIRAKERQWYDQPEEELRRSLAGYYGNISQVDACIGRVLSALADCGLDRNTIVVYTSDHGEMAGAHRMWTKHNMYDESVRIPLLVRLPGQQQASLHPELVEQVDLYPLLADLCGLPPPRQIHGRSFAPLLRGEPFTPRQAVFAQYDFCRNVFTRDDRYVGKPPLRMIRTQRYKLNHLDWGRDELFDLAADPGEHCNRIDDPSLSDVADDLLQKLHQRTS